MGRWEPEAEQRLREAAMELFAERGYEHTTVADIAQRAGLTARTFFRYFTDKRDVLFGRSVELEAAMVAAVESAPREAGPLDAISVALDEAARLIGTNRAHSRRRQAVIAANAELRERELAKMASLSAAMAEGLRRRGVRQPDAGLAAETGTAVFRVAFERWAGPGRAGSLEQLMGESLARLRALVTVSS